jgi:hypothetical protein
MQLHRVRAAVDSAVVAQPDERRGPVSPQVTETNIAALVVGQNDLRQRVSALRRVCALSL